MSAEIMVVAHTEREARMMIDTAADPLFRQYTAADLVRYVRTKRTHDRPSLDMIDGDYPGAFPLLVEQNEN